MKRKLKIIIPIVIIIIIIFITIPMFELKTDKKLYAIRYTDDYSEFETNDCYEEKYFYNKKNNISLSNFNHKKFLFFNLFSFDYVEGNICETEFQLEEEYIKKVIEQATITYNSHNINLAQLIEGKTPIVGNSNYSGNNYNMFIEYTLEEKNETMYIFYQYGLTIIQVGKVNEAKKFIAYK